MSMITVPRVGGLAMIAGSILYIVATLITPGYVIGETYASDLYGLVETITQNTFLTAFAAVLSVVSLMFLLWGLTMMWQTAQSKCALDIFVKFGMVGVMVAVIFLMVAQTANYTTSHVIEHGVGVGAGQDQESFLRITGMYLQSLASLARATASIAGLMGYVVLGFALARKFQPGAYRIVAFIVAISAIVSLIGVILTQPFPDVIDTLAPVFNVLSMFHLVWWIIIGVGIYQERFGLRIGVTPEH